MQPKTSWQLWSPTIQIKVDQMNDTGQPFELHLTHSHFQSFIREYLNSLD